jgi:deoxycytidylate deaminase
MAIASLAAKRSESPPFVWGGCVIVQDKKVIFNIFLFYLTP